MATDVDTLIHEIFDRWETAQEAEVCAHQAFPEIANVPEFGAIAAELATGICHGLEETDSREEWLNLVCHTFVVAMAASYAVAVDKTADAMKPF